MANIYDAMVAALREHWDACRCIAAAVRTDSEGVQCVDGCPQGGDVRRKLLSPSGWEAVFHGIPVSVVEGADCHVVDKNGQRTSLGIAPLYWDADGRQDRRHTPKSQGS
jgi:hypothetical protein